MSDCAHPDCDGDGRMRYTCRYCEKAFCPDHRLPEAHNCFATADTTFETTSSSEPVDPDDYLIHGYVAIVVGVALVVGLGFLLATSLPTLAVPSLDLGGSGAVAASNTSATATPAATSTTTATPASGTDGYNRSEVERIFIALLNDERESRGLQPVSQREALTEMGIAHSRNMALNDYIGHEEPGPGGSTVEERYRERGLLPECQLPIEGSQEYYAGAENANAVHIGNYETTYNEFVTIQSEQEIARVLFKEWMHSPGHREAMLVASADEVGLGIWIGGEGVVYASLELC
jgi:uncharacterized protein YkwD